MVFDEEMHKIAIILCIVIGIVVGGLALSSVFKATDHIVQNSGNPQLQATYQTGKEMISDAGDLKDGSDLSNSVSNLGK